MGQRRSIFGMRILITGASQGIGRALAEEAAARGAKVLAAARNEYSASKFAVQGFSEALRAELAKDGIDVLVVCPGLTQTNFSHNMIEQKALVPLDHMRGMSAEDVARHTLRCIEAGTNEVC